MTAQLLGRRELQALRLLLAGPVTREGLDRALSVSNGPDVVHRIRKGGFRVRTRMLRGRNRDGVDTRFAEYRLPDGEVQAVLDFLARHRVVAAG